MPFDWVKASLCAGGVGLAIFSSAAVYVLVQNSTSKNLIFAFSALAGAFVLFLLQLIFELQGGSTLYEHLSTELTIDRAKPEIRQPISPTVEIADLLRWQNRTFLKMQMENSASEWLASKNPTAFEIEKVDRVATDLVIFSLVSFIQIQQQDWQVKRLEYKGSMFSVKTATRTSRDADCATITKEAIEAALKRADNLFAGAPLYPFPKICLPPESIIEISGTSLAIKNPICAVVFRVTPPASKMFTKPFTYATERPMLKDGKPQYVTMLLGIDVTTQFFDLRANHRDANRYKSWAARVVNDA